MREVRQLYVQGPSRSDGHTDDGTPGDCWRTALASLLDLEPEEVPHFGLYTRDRWWFETRLWLQRTQGLDLWFCDDHEVAGIASHRLVLLSGKSPRGDFYHVVVGHPDGTVVMDPHPSRDGIRTVEEVFVLVEPYGFLEERRAICA